MAFDFSYYEMAEKLEAEEADNQPTFTTVVAEDGTTTRATLVGLVSPLIVTTGDSDDGITTGGSGSSNSSSGSSNSSGGSSNSSGGSSNSSGGSSGDDDADDGGGDDDDDDDDQQLFNNRPAATTYISSNLRTRTYDDEVRYRDAIFRPFLMNQDWDRGPDFRLCRDFVSSCRDQDGNIVHNNVISLDRSHNTYPFVWDYEWEVVPG